ncbi:MAG: nitrogenase component 1 [Clostridiales Family XIII bacterium]|jgi:nitrogenase molybdenum-iron protein alpha/beta subunit|nr:nitrogenase component 1 [Clostridiales Family XIII bacterium]
MTETSHLKRLSELNSNTGIHFLTPAAQPGNHCPLYTAMRFAGGVDGLSTLLVGTPECSTYSRKNVARDSAGNGTLHWSYVLDSNDVVFGCHDGLIDAIIEMDKAGARAILVAVTCVPELVGEDVGAILRETKGRVSAKLAHVMLGNFKCIDTASGSWKSLEAMVDFMEPEAKQPDLINMLGDDDGQATLPQALEKRGFRPRFIGQGASLGEYEAAPGAALNIIVSTSAVQMAGRMKKEFGTPYVDMCGLYAPEDLRGAYAEIGEILGIELQDEFDAKQAILLQEDMREKLAGKTFILPSMRGGAGLALTAYLTELGMVPLLLDLSDFSAQDKKWAARITQKGVDPPVCHMINGEADSQVLAGFAPNFLLSAQRRGGRHGGQGGGSRHHGGQGGGNGRQGGSGGGSSADGMNGFPGYERTVSLLKYLENAAARPAEPRQPGGRRR